MKNMTSTIIMLFALFASPLFAQQPTLKDPLLDRMTGKWILTGKIAGQETTHDINAEWVLNHQYVRIHEVSREKNKDGDPAYLADVYVGWDQAAGEYICIWIDVWGGASASTIGRAKPHGDEIRYLFRDSTGAPSFHTTFVYNKESDTWQWIMDNDDNGTLKPFARVILKRD